jgi:RNA polymerase sigma factor (sigma-70 family)
MKADMSESDRECVRLCLDGRPEAFRELVERYQAPLVSYLSGRLNSRDLAEEAAQETFVRSFFALRKLRKPELFYSWLFGIASRVLREYRRDVLRMRPAEPLTEMPAQESPSPDYELQCMVGRLPRPYREVILLHYYGGLSCAETAEKLAVPVGTVTKRLSRAHQMLRERLERQGSRMETSEARG